MKKSRIVLVALAILMVFAAVSCKEPHVHSYGDPQVKDGKVVQICECGDAKEVADAVAVGNEAALKESIEDGSKTIYLAKSITLSNTITIKNGKEVCIFLNGFDISSAGCCFIMDTSGNGLGGVLKIEGNGSVSTTSNFVFCVKGNSNSEREAVCKLSIGKDVKISGTYAISVYPATGDSCYDVKIDIYGKVEGKQPIYVNGKIANTEKAIELNIHDGAEINCLDSAEVYLAGYARTTVGKANVTSEGNAISISAGELVVNGSTITAGKKEGSAEGSGGSISTKYSSAIYVKQHSTNLGLKVSVNSGVFSGYIPFYQDKGEAVTPKPELVEISITGGEFKVLSSDGPSVKSEDKTGFISGGAYTVAPDVRYIKEGFEAKKLADNSWEIVSK